MLYGISMAQLQSTLEVYNIETGKREIILQENSHFEAPNWSRDGKFLIFNSAGKLYRLELTTGEKKLIETGKAQAINNDHGISFDGSAIVFSNTDLNGETDGGSGGSSKVYVMPINGGHGTRITPLGPSYWHGWSPDGKTLAYVGMRDGEFDIYVKNADGTGNETRLTTAKGLDDGPEYSYDGEFIYYNSMKSGKMEIWRMKPDGSQKTQLTDDAYANWFPHPSPSNDKFVYIAYLKDQGSDHPPMKDVMLRLYDLKDKSIKTLCKFTGGQGTINVHSWAPDGKRFAFVSYKEIKE